MTPFYFFLFLLLFWSILPLTIKALRKLKETRKSEGLFIEETASEHENEVTSCSSRHSIHTSLFQIRYTTTSLNGFFRKVATYSPNFWNHWFTVGVCFGLAAMLFGLGLIALAGWRISVVLCQNWFANKTEIGDGLPNDSSDGEPSGQVLIPMIPGVTLPLSHLVYYLLALFISGIVHEVGHAVAAICERVPVHSFGTFLIFLYPGAFVDISSRNLTLLSPFRKLRVICAGVWHNAVLFLIIWCLLSSGAMNLGFSLVGWTILHPNDGLAVVNVAQDSPLSTFLSQSSLITRLDDTPLDHGFDSWSRFLLEAPSQDRLEHSKGFCVLQPEMEVEPLECCEISSQHPFGQSHNESISCFTSLVDTEQEIGPKFACLPSMQTITQGKRCQVNTDCDVYHQDGFTSGNCMEPYNSQSNAKLLRIYFREPEWNLESVSDVNDKVVVFMGDYAEVWNTVQVSVLRPRWWFIPTSLPFMVESTLRYILSFTLALSILNILPAYHLDGHHALSAILSMIFSCEQGSNGQIQLKKATEKTILMVTSVLMGWVVIGSLIVVILGLH
ncbi:hypothetical protein K7432_002857 [Basidiobolus ranarum]|uniref:Endopeptidase S2P n=1 Tax=Basidiobolus ranarum TaxID=34480 RepID=A0ABR2W747_9FUNG